MGTFKKQFLDWKNKFKENGPRAMTRFVIMLFVEGLQEVSPDRYIFKGGNLLWHYIKTPRSTVDLDFATNTEIEVQQVLNDFSAVQIIGCEFKIKNHKKVDTLDKSGINVQMEFLTEEGSKNSFGIDVVFAVNTHSKKIKLSSIQVTAASLENIIIDKIAACYRFAGGNTRMKDFDDLYRIAASNPKIDSLILQKLSLDREIKLHLNTGWINNQIQTSWIEYTQKKVYKGGAELPNNIRHVIEFINEYLSNVTNIA